MNEQATLIYRQSVKLRHLVFVFGLAWLLLILPKGNTFGQKARLNLNELKQELQQHKILDSNRVKLLLQLAGAYLERQSDSAHKYALQATQLAEKLKIQRFHITALEYLGRAQYAKSQFDQALQTFKKEEAIAKDYAEKAQSIRNQGNVYIEIGQQKEALDSYKRSLDMAYLSKHQFTIAVSLVNLGYLYKQTGEYDIAVSYLLKASKLGEDNHFKVLLANVYLQLALIQNGRKIYKEAIDYAKKANEIFVDLNNVQGQGSALSVLGAGYAALNENTTARKYLLDAYQLNLRLNDTRQIYNSLNNLAEIELVLQNYVPAGKYADQAIAGLKQINNTINLIGAYTTRGKILIGQKQFRQAEANLDSALAIAQKHQYRPQKKNVLEAFALLRAAQGNYNEAFNTLLATNKLNDSVLNETNSKQINELITKYETEKKQAQIALLNEQNIKQQLRLFNNQLTIEKQDLQLSNQNLEIENKNLNLKQKENTIARQKQDSIQHQQKIVSLNQQNIIQNLELQRRNLYLLLSGLALLIVIVFALATINRRKLKAKAELQQEIIKQQDLATKAVLEAEERERRRIAGDLHDGVGQMLSAALMNMNGLISKIDPKSELALNTEKALALVSESYDEMRSISHQMMPNALIKSGLASAVKEFLSKLDSDKIKVGLETIGLNERLDEQTETVIYRAIQESVNNTVKHAKATKLNIQIIKDEEGISVTIEDNGKGFDQSKLGSKKGIGLSNLYARVELLKGTVDVDSAEGKGTLIALHIPNKPA